VLWGSPACHDEQLEGCAHTHVYWHCGTLYFLNLSWFSAYKVIKKTKYACNRKFTEVYVRQKLSKQSVIWQSYCKNKMVQLFLTQTVQSIPHYFVTYTGNKSQNYRTTFLISNYYKTIYIFDQKPKDVKLHYKWEQTNMKTSKLPIYTANLAYAGVTKCTTKIYKLYKCQTRCSAIAERPRCRVHYSFRRKTGSGRQYFTDIIRLSSTTVI